MNHSSNLTVAMALLLSISSCSTHIVNSKQASVKVYGNCEMCEKSIEDAGSREKLAQVDWNKDSKMAILTYDSLKTSKQEILKRIALAGYDSDEFLAPDDAYAELPECCRYTRMNKRDSVQVENHEMHSEVVPDTISEPEKGEDQIKVLAENYFSLKDAFVKSDQKSASSLAKEFLTTANGVEMDKLTSESHMVWMGVMKNLKENAEAISTANSIESQRKAFMSLSDSMYGLLKVSQPEAPVYYQNCPMYNDGKGANWLSEESVIKNPYYGSQMLNCGKTIETIK